METDVMGRRKQTRGIRQCTPITINFEYLKLNIKNKEQHMFLVSIKESYHVSTMASYYIVGGVVVTHTLYNLHSIHITEKEHGVSSNTHTGPALSLSCHPVTIILQTGCVYTVLMHMDSNHGTLFLL